MGDYAYPERIPAVRAGHGYELVRDERIKGRDLRAVNVRKSAGTVKDLENGPVLAPEEPNAAHARGIVRARGVSRAALMAYAIGSAFLST